MSQKTPSGRRVEVGLGTQGDKTITTDPVSYGTNRDVHLTLPLSSDPRSSDLLYVVPDLYQYEPVSYWSRVIVVIPVFLLSSNDGLHQKHVGRGYVYISSDSSFPSGS